MNKAAKLLTTLEGGAELTAKQIGARFVTDNPYDLVYRLREAGHPIYLNKRRNSKGDTTLKYRLGTPKKHGNR